MIAICPSCHDVVDRGLLTIDDETLYRWKSIRRPAGSPGTHIYVEPGQVSPKLLLGSISVQGGTDFVVFELSPESILEFCVRDSRILIPRMRVGSADQPLIDVVDGHVVKKKDSVNMTARAGKVVVTDPELAARMPPWAIKIINHPLSGIDLAAQPLLELEVIEPGLLRVQGVWLREDSIVIINEKQLSFLNPGLVRPLSMLGAGAATVINVQSSVMFAIQGC